MNSKNSNGVKKFSLGNLSKMINKEIVENTKITNNQWIDLTNSSTLIIDGSFLFIRAFAIATNMKNGNGDFKNIISLFFRTLFNEIDRSNANNILIIFDGKDTTKNRREIFKDYKMNRGGGITSKKSFRESIKKLIEIMQQELPIKTYIANGFESDDVISYLATVALPKYNNKSVRNIILSADKDFQQLLSDNVIIYNPIKKDYVTKENFITEHEVLPSNYIFEKIITGDKSDNVDGLKGIGKGMVKKHLSSQLNMINEDYSNDFDKFLLDINDKVVNKRLKKLITENENKLERNFKLMSLSKDIVSNNIPVRERTYLLDFVRANPLFENVKDLNIVKLLNVMNLPVDVKNIARLNKILNNLGVGVN